MASGTCKRQTGGKQRVAVECVITRLGLPVLACAGCGKYDGGEFYLDPVEGRLLCADCAEKARHITNLDNGALYALRHICLAEDKKLFGFKISPESLQELSRTSEQYTLAHLEHGLKSLDFLKSVLE